MRFSLAKVLFSSLLTFILLLSHGWSQEYYWTFEEGKGMVDLKKKKELKTKRARVAQDPSGRSFLKVGCETTGNIQLCEVPPQKQFSMEFLLRYDLKNCDHTPRVIFGNYASVIFQIMPGFIGFHNSLKTPKGKKSIYTSEKLMGEGRKSISYYLDGNWHHIAFVFDGVNGVGGVWVDGKKVASNQESLKGYTMGERPFFLNIEQRFAGDLDDIAVYYRTLSPFEIAQHASASLAGKTYGTQVKSRSFPPVIAKANMQIDQQEFAPGHPNVLQSPYKQLAEFPYPRYKKDHGLRPLFNWMGIPYIGGFTQEGIKIEQASRSSADITELMADKFHYSLVIPNSKEISVGKPLDVQYVVVRDMVNLANRRKDLPLGMITLWLQTKMTLLEGETQMSPYVVRKNLPANYYMRNAKGEFIQANGVPHKTIRWLSPSAPGDLFEKEGIIQKRYINYWLELLDRPIDIINENGEAPPYEWRKKVMEVDPSAKVHFQKSGIKDWDVYAAKQKIRFRRTYSDPFVKGIPGLKNTLFTWYGVDAGPVNRFKWSESRYINKPINGQYYSTPDFYPRFPDNWQKWKGPWRGWEWLDISRKEEIMAGDKLFSPYLGAGWDIDPVKNIRPSQWLGLIKLLGPIGAEFYYTGFFNETPWGFQGKPRFADPKNYIWQAALPSYAQALTSYYEDVLREGELLRDKKGQPIVTTPVNDPRFLVVVRKAKGEERYIIAGGIFPLSNQKGQVPDEGEVWVPIGNKKYNICFRRQGSVYELDLSEKEPFMRQLDGWHETGHPSFWSKDLNIEAELWESSKGASLRTEWSSPAKENDLSGFSSYVRTDKGNASISYSITPNKSSSKFEILLRGRSKAGGKNKLTIKLDGKAVKTVKMKSGAWKTHSIKVNRALKQGKPYELEIQVQQKGTEIDSFIIHQP